MRLYKLEILPDAYADIVTIYNYIAHDLDEPENAEIVYNYIMDKIFKLKSSPRVGQYLVVNDKLSDEVRLTHVKKYNITYYVENETVIILQVFHSKMNINRIFRERR